ncbi:hypothetical protein PO124_05025 [Bacillus licheniformis]|nr:hypothetical protein [Bacillus licheniformis]
MQEEISDRSFPSSAMKRSKTLSKWFKAALNRSRSICLRMKNGTEAHPQPDFIWRRMYQ